MYKNVQKINRTKFQQMLSEGKKFKNWSLYEPSHNPQKIYYIVDLGKGLTINKTETK